jgi:succinoglycan biosynthesis transport protein ExoP
MLQDQLPPPALPATPKTMYVDLPGIFWRHRLLLAAGLFLGLLAGGSYCFWKGPEYESTAQILVLKKRLDTAPLTGPQSSPSQDEDYLATHQVVITSPRIIKAAIAEHHLGDLKSLGDKPKPASTVKEGLSTDRVFTLKGGSSPNNIMNLTFRSADPEDSQKVLEAVLDQYQKFLDETYRDVTKETYQLIAQARDVLKKDLLTLRHEYLQFQKNSPLLVKSKDGGTLHQERLFKISEKRSDLQMRRAEIELALATIDKALKLGGLGEAMNLLSGFAGKKSLAAVGSFAVSKPAQGEKSTNASLEEILVGLQMERVRLEEKFGPNHSAVQDINHRLNLVSNLLLPPATVSAKVHQKDSLLEQFVEMKIHLLKQELSELENADQAMEKLFQTELVSTRDITLAEASEENFRHNIDQTQQLYQSILKRVQELDTVKDFGGYKTQILSAPQKGQWLWRTMALAVAIGGFGGLILGAGAAVATDLADKTVRSPGELRQLLGVSALSHIPRFRKVKPASPAGTGEKPRLDPRLLAYLQPESPESLAFRAVYAGLAAEFRTGDSRVLQITSADTGDGKTLLAANLAVTLTQAGKKVLLIDADLCRPELHQWFGLLNTTGLTSLLQGQASLDEAVQDTTIPGLSLLSSGPVSAGLGKLLAGSRFGEMLKELRPRYDVILLDTPGLLTAAEPALAAGQTDALLLAVRIVKHGRPRLTAAREILNRLPTKVMAVVVNAVRPDRLTGAGTVSEGTGY